MKTYWKKFKMFWREIGNLLTNVLCPLLATVAAILEIFGAPITWINGIKKAEYWCWNACGTKEKIDAVIEGIDKVVDKLPEEGDKNENNAE